VTVTPSSLWRRTGGISLKEAGVDATSCLCSAGDTERGASVIRVTGDMFASLVKFKG